MVALRFARELIDDARLILNMWHTLEARIAQYVDTLQTLLFSGCRDDELLADLENCSYGYVVSNSNFV